MAHRRVCTRWVLEPLQLLSSNQKGLLRSVQAKNIATAVSSERIQQPCDSDPYPSVVEGLRRHFSKSGILTDIGIVDVLRRWHPNHTLTQTPVSTGILKLAKAGFAKAEFDTNVDFYASRTYKPATGGAQGTGRLKDKVQVGRYKYRWEDQDFQVYVADYWVSECYQVRNHYILYPRREGNVMDGRSQTVDRLITDAARHLSEIKEEIWVYNRGYWRKSHKLWKNVQDCKWENVILNNEMKLQLVSDVEGFFDRKEDYKIVRSAIEMERLDAGISKRPSRFDRKYYFALPATPERIQYCEYWRLKLSNNPSLRLPPQISSAIANITEGFSFAYLQEALITALLSIVQTQRANPVEPEASGIPTSDDLGSNAVWQAISKQVQTLRKEMKDSRKSVEDAEKNSMLSDPHSSSATSTGFGFSR